MGRAVFWARGTSVTGHNRSRAKAQWLVESESPASKRVLEMIEASAKTERVGVSDGRRGFCETKAFPRIEQCPSAEAIEEPEKFS